jgi:hypothetical protein
MRPCALLLIVLAVPTCVCAQIKEPEVILSGQVWRYPRVYPLLDGLFQDVASTQLKNLALDPNASNGTSLDALQQSFQFQLQYSQLAGIQNASAAQSIATNTGYQTQLIQQQSTLLQAQLLAQNQLGALQKQSDSLPSNADPNTIASAKQAVTVAQDNLNSITAQMALVKGQLTTTPYSPTPATGSLVPSQLPPAPTIPSSLATGATSSPPSFPATKQMDNQMELLWERLSRLVGAMARPDSLDSGASLYLVAFDTGIFPEKDKRKHQLLDTTYDLECSAGSGTPTVLDMFPRVAAVNITNVKYRDTSFGIGALLSFFGIGVSGSYNREHLRLSQLLGQSSYITGHGVGQTEFGWLFGIAVGDDQVSSDTRKTFALVEVPSSCTAASIALKSAKWSSKPEPINSNLTWTIGLPSAATTAVGVASISYNRIEYDPKTASATNPASVTITLGLDKDMDQQETVSVNGIPIKRARDTFGRAITAGGSGGLLESATLGINTWIPSGPRTLIVTLDASMFAERFPLVLLSSPANTIEVGKTWPKEVLISGRELKCDPTPCPGGLPSLGYATSSVKHFAAARWMGKTRPADKICITVTDSTPTQAVTPGPTPSSIPSIQVVSSADNQIWGSNVIVNMIRDDGGITPLKCDPPQAGSRYVCDAPGYVPASDTYSTVYLEILDTGHAGGPIKGAVDLSPCSNSVAAANYCRQPLVWDLKNPQLDPSQSQWLFDILLANVDNDADVAFEEDKAIKGKVACRGNETLCLARIAIPESEFFSVKDSMKLHMVGADGKTYPATITNLFSNVRPVVTQIETDKTSWTGQNLIFSKLRISDTGSTFSLDCSDDASKCYLKGKYGSKDTGFMYLLGGAQSVQLVQWNASGGFTPLHLDLPKPPAAAGAPGGAPTGTPPPTVPKSPPLQAIQ